ncbi:aldehyde dehydrogenase family protein [Paraburkholderia sp. RL17-337-BIB-A]|uniref:aldehyde dehydrogenase family protein n=1 Tax=Paraburkholderia sp. RL17-337-BIB-A TaxID=3031636 RepID=UPI0038B81240
MHQIDHIYIDGAFVTPHGSEWADLHNPSTEAVIGRVRLGDAEDARAAISAAKRAFPLWSRTSKADRIDLLHRLHKAVAASASAQFAALQEEYGAPFAFGDWLAKAAGNAFLEAANMLKNYEFERSFGKTQVVMQPLGVVAAITPWNANAFFLCGKMATAIAAGCTVVLKPSEMSALQTQVLVEALHEAGAPPGLFNIVNGRGDVVGAEFSVHPHVAKLNFTGSTGVGRSIMTAAAQTMKRVTLELGGKGPQIILDDADLDAAIPTTVASGLMNSGQACIAGTRILVPESRKAEILSRLKSEIAKVRVGDPKDSSVTVGPMVSKKQWDRVQGFLRIGLDEGAELLVGGEGRPDGMDAGWFVRPTVFSNVTNEMRIAREEIFGPVLSVLSYETEEQAIEIANDTPYGLQAFVLSSNAERARAVAAQLDSGRVQINNAYPEANVPFGGFKQSGIGREGGVFGLEAHLEPKAIVA